MNNFKKDNFDLWHSLFILVSVLFIFLHLYFSFFHFHECDSSAFFEYLKDNSKDNMHSFINSVTPKYFIKIRYFIAEISQNLNYDPFQKFIQIPYVSTYPPLMGLIFGSISTKTFDGFYYIAAFINSIALLISSWCLYFTFLNLNFSKRTSFISSSLLLTLYATNSYSYHLGSTVWYVLSFSVGIFLLSFESIRIKDIGYSILQFGSYPFIVWIFCQFIFESIYLIFTNKINKNNLIIYILKIIKIRPLTTIGLITNIVLFLPFNSGYRYGPDLRGLYTIFSFQPLNDQNHIFTILFAILIYWFCLYGLFLLINIYLEGKKYSNNNLFKVINLFAEKIYSNKKYKIIISCVIFLIVFSLLVISRKLTFSTTRHSLFIIPSILIVSSFGLEELIKKVNNNYFDKIISFNSIIFITLTFLLSINSSFQRVDILKMDNLPNYINNFVKSSKNLDYSIIGCSPHYKYADFSQKRFSYNLPFEHTISNLYEPGIKLLISQRPIISKSIGEFDNEFSQYLFFDKPKAGDTILIKSKNVKIRILDKPYIKKTSVYFDSLNQNSKIFNLFHLFRKLKTFYINELVPSKIESNNKSNFLIYKWYNFYSNATGEEYRYPRPNDIWLIPIQVEDLKN